MIFILHTFLEKKVELLPAILSGLILILSPLLTSKNKFKLLIFLIKLYHIL